jgi:hypothetical protein
LRSSGEAPKLAALEQGASGGSPELRSLLHCGKSKLQYQGKPNIKKARCVAAQCSKKKRRKLAALLHNVAKRKKKGSLHCSAEKKNEGSSLRCAESSPRSAAKRKRKKKKGLLHCSATKKKLKNKARRIIKKKRKEEGLPL